MKIGSSYRIKEIIQYLYKVNYATIWKLELPEIWYRHMYINRSTYANYILMYVSMYVISLFPAHFLLTIQLTSVKKAF